MDSVMSDFSAVHFGRPGLGDKMFDNAADHGPLTSISASPPESDASQRRFGRRNSFDSIMDEEQRFSMLLTLYRSGPLPPHQFRPLSVLSTGSVYSLADDDVTMISVSSFKPQCVRC